MSDGEFFEMLGDLDQLTEQDQREVAEYVKWLLSEERKDTLRAS